MVNFNGFINVVYKKFSKDSKMVEGKSSFKFSDLQNWNENWGFEVPEHTVVIDFDTKKEFDLVLEIIKDKKVKCYISSSQNPERGGHIYFRIPQDVHFSNKIDATLAIGLTDVDFKSGQQTSFIVEYKNNQWNKWVEGFEPQYKEIGINKGFILDPCDLDEVPFWLMPLKSKSLSFVGLTEGDGRNNELFRHKWRLVNAGFKQEQVEEIFKIINIYIFKDKLDEKELATLYNFTPEMNQALEKRWFDDKGNFLHWEMAKYISKTLYAYRGNIGTVYYFDGEIYRPDKRVLEQTCARECEELRDYQIQEVAKRVALTSDISTIKPFEYHPYIACKNGLVDTNTGKKIGFTPNYFITNKIDIDYDATAYDKDVDTFLDEVLVEKGDEEQRKIFEEYLGYTICFRDNSMKKMIIMIGPRNNGKSTLIYTIQSLLGEDNYSALKLFEIDDKNDKKIGQLANKIANFDDDADKSLIKANNMSYLKTLVSDENKVTINNKFEQPYKDFIRAKFWIGSNHVIKTEQKGEEWMTRLLILAFHNIFEGSRRNPNIKMKLVTDNAKSYLLKLAIEGAMRLRKQGEFTKSAVSEKEIENYRIENDSVYKFLYQKQYMMKDFDQKLVRTFFNFYKVFMEDNDDRYIVNIDNFEKRVIEYYKNKLGSKINDNHERIFYCINNTSETR